VPVSKRENYTMNNDLILTIFHKLDELKDATKCSYHKCETETIAIEKYTFRIDKPHNDEITVVKEVYPDGRVNLSGEQILEDGVPLWNSFIRNAEILNQLLLAIESVK
jgi:hypothetical protein